MHPSNRKVQLRRSVMISALLALPATVAWAQGPAEAMSIAKVRTRAFARCQAPFLVPEIPPIPALDPPGAGDLGMNFHEELAVRTTNLLDRDEFYVNPRPRAAVNSLPMEVFVEVDRTGTYVGKTWNDANPDYSSSVIRPPISRDSIPEAGRVLTEVIFGHRAPKGDWPQLFDIRSSAYVRFAGFPPQVTGASLRLGVHGVTSAREDFPIIRSIYLSIVDRTTATALALVESQLFCGALKLDLSPRGGNAEIVVDGYWYTREDFRWRNDPHTGFVGYSSMTWKTEKATPERISDEAHDSDMMTVKFEDGTQARYPVEPPTETRVRDLTALAGGKRAVSWILANEDRDRTHYADFSPALQYTNYDLRASYDVTILESSVKTGVSLYEMPPVLEYADNIVALSTIRQDIPKARSADEFVRFKYRTTAFFPEEPDQCEFIRQALDALPRWGGVVEIPAGTYDCKRKIVVKRSHVKIRGEGRDITTLRLADRSPSPVLVIGDDKVIQAPNGNWVTETRVSHVDVSDLTIDGNLANQDPRMECGAGTCDGDVSNIRNNALTIRGASYVTINRVTAHHAISGGLVTEKYCDHLLVSDFTSYGNYFDGFAGYQTEDSIFVNLNLSRNRGAGISIDIHFNRNKFSSATLASNGDVGIFARELSGNLFENLKITRSGNHGVFLANSDQPGTCANDNEFRSVTIQGSRGNGIHLASPCTGNKVTGRSVLQDNRAGCFFVHAGTTMTVEPSVSCR